MRGDLLLAGSIDHFCDISVRQCEMRQVKTMLVKLVPQCVPRGLAVGRARNTHVAGFAVGEAATCAFRTFVLGRVSHGETTDLL